MDGEEVSCVQETHSHDVGSEVKGKGKRKERDVMEGRTGYLSSRNSGIIW